MTTSLISVIECILSLGVLRFERNVEERKRDERIRGEMVNFFCLEHRINRRNRRERPN
jgi:hypothetical protein